MQKKAILKAGKEKPILNRHHWIFSGAIEKIYLDQPGDLIEVFSHQNVLLGYAYFNPKCSLMGRMVSFGSKDPYQVIEENLSNALELRKKIFSPKEGYRLVNGEGDLLPGLVIDRYGPTLVLQIGALGMEKLKNFIIDLLKKLLPDITSIYEKSTSPSREEEGLEKKEGLLSGKELSNFEILENGIKFLIDIPISQKTGLYLDHREMRSLLGSLSRNKNILNCFAYTGGFSLYGAKGGAKKIVTIDSSNWAISIAQKNFQINNFVGDYLFLGMDAFDFIEQNDLSTFDIIIIDPPAFAKKKNQIDKAKEKYQQLNRTVMKKMKKNSLLFTSSCSYHIDSSLFKYIITSAGKQADRQLKIISSHRQALDHPINPFHPESEYLKGFVLEII
jgi:23S rRNA (cytosine1962-C5)-methyltransferase